jgi:hypothetical protein
MYAADSCERIYFRIYARVPTHTIYAAIVINLSQQNTPLWSRGLNYGRGPSQAQGGAQAVQTDKTV